jgi:hypothetical protein
MAASVFCRATISSALQSAGSAKVENLAAAVSLHFAHYNWVRIHGSLRMTPAMAAA